MFERLDFDAIRLANPLPAVVGSLVPLMPSGHEWKARCPFPSHPENTPSFTIYSGGLRFHCFGCGATGDVLDFMQMLYGCTLVEAAGRLGGAHTSPVSDHSSAVTSNKPDRVAEAKAIWRNSAPISGTLAETYLRRRGITAELPDTLRYGRISCGAGSRLLPCLIACVSADRRFVGIQRTYLNASGGNKAAMRKPKLSLGKIAGGAIRLAPPAKEIIVCEGLEDGLTLMQSNERPVWVAAGGSMLRLMRFPDVVESVIVAADNDLAGQNAARDACRAFRNRGLTAGIVYPAPDFKDFNDELRGKRK